MVDVELIVSYYHHLSKYELRKVICCGKLFMGVFNDERIGFVGEHLEGSIGILKVLRQYRGRGFGKELDRFMIIQMLEKRIVILSDRSE